MSCGNSIFSIDTHWHTTISDGANDESEMVSNVLQRKREDVTRILSATDHDIISIRGVTDLRDLVVVVPGVEISASIFDNSKGKTKNLHFACYAESLPYEKQLEKILLNTRIKKNEKTYKRLKEIIRVFGLNGSSEDCRRYLMVNRGIVNLSSKSFIYEYLFSIKENRYILDALFGCDEGQKRFFYEQIFEKDGEYYQECKVGKEFPVYKPQIAEVVKLLPKGSIVSLAHPQISFKTEFKESDTRKVEKRLLSCITSGINAIEINSRANEKDVEMILYLARKYNLIVTMGSDSHGIGFGDSRHGELGEHNPFLEETQIDEIGKNFLTRLGI